MATEKDDINEITITRATRVGLKRVERGDVLGVGVEIIRREAVYLINLEKAVAGKVNLDAPPAKSDGDKKPAKQS